VGPETTFYKFMSNDVIQQVLILVDQWHDLFVNRTWYT